MLQLTDRQNDVAFPIDIEVCVFRTSNGPIEVKE